MKLYYHKDPLGNFGDDLNPWLFGRLLPRGLSGFCFHEPSLRRPGDAEGELLLGIGTLINDVVPRDAEKYVFGSGAGYGSKPQIDGHWHFLCVRGPRTAGALGLPSDLAITDPAVLCQTVELPAPAARVPLSFMPHCASARQGYWREVCDVMNLRYIDPHSPVDRVLAEIAGSERLITEALHGAIVADALRVPWHPVSSHSGVLEFKWLDWCESLRMSYRPSALPALWSSANPTWAERLKRPIKFNMATRALRAVAERSQPCLSDSSVLSSAVDRLRERLEILRRQLGRCDG